jgi:RNase P subunit RPR2
MTDDLAPAMQLMVELIQQTSADVRCRSCDQPLLAPGVTVHEADDDRIVAVVQCRKCQFRVEVLIRPAAVDGFPSFR